MLSLSLSHSGQTFPTLHATHILQKSVGDRVFVITGSTDSKMTAAVGQQSYPDAPWKCRSWSTNTGWRPAEPLTVSTVALHQVIDSYPSNFLCVRYPSIHRREILVKM